MTAREMTIRLIRTALIVSAGAVLLYLFAAALSGRSWAGEAVAIGFGAPVSAFLVWLVIDAARRGELAVKFRTLTLERHPRTFRVTLVAYAILAAILAGLAARAVWRLLSG